MVVLSGGIHAAIANPFEQWFSLRVAGSGEGGLDAELNSDPETLAWLEKVSDIIMDCYTNPQANHKQSMHTYFLGQGCIGTSVILQEWDDDLDGPCFATISMAGCWIDIDNKGRVNKVYRKVEWTKDQAILQFGEENLSPKLLAEKPSKDKHVFIHAVEPRIERNPRGKGAKDMPWKSVWVMERDKWVCKESGYETLPYHVGRWEVIENEEYGRSPAMTALPVIRICNQHEKICLRADQKVVDPPLAIPHDAFMSQLDMTPGAVNVYDSTAGLGEKAVFPIQSGAQPDAGEKRQQQRYDTINSIFYTDLGSIPFKKERQTTLEIQAQQDAILRNIAPLVGRQEAELLGPMIQRTYQLCSKWNKIPPHPLKIRGKKLKIVYLSRAAMAIRGGKLGQLRAYVTDTIIPMAQVAPEIKDTVDMDMICEVSADLSGVTRKIIRTPQQVAAIRKDRAQQQAQAQQLQAAESASTSLKNVGQAGQAMPSLVGQ